MPVKSTFNSFLGITHLVCIIHIAVSNQYGENKIRLNIISSLHSFISSFFPIPSFLSSLSYLYYLFYKLLASINLFKYFFVKAEEIIGLPSYRRLLELFFRMLYY